MLSMFRVLAKQFRMERLIFCFADSTKTLSGDRFDALTHTSNAKEMYLHAVHFKGKRYCDYHGDMYQDIIPGIERLVNGEVDWKDVL